MQCTPDTEVCRNITQSSLGSDIDIAEDNLENMAKNASSSS